MSLLCNRVSSGCQQKELAQVTLKKLRKLYIFIMLRGRVWHLSGLVLGRWSSEATAEENQFPLHTFSLKHWSSLGFFPFFSSAHSSVHSSMLLHYESLCLFVSLYVYLSNSSFPIKIMMCGCVFVCWHGSEAASRARGLVKATLKNFPLLTLWQPRGCLITMSLIHN